MMLPTVCKKLFTSIDLGYFSCDNEFDNLLPVPVQFFFTFEIVYVQYSW